jgi:hypothetical protein
MEGLRVVKKKDDIFDGCEQAVKSGLRVEFDDIFDGCEQAQLG